MMEILSFDGVLTDVNGNRLDVDCNVMLPIVSGAAAAVTIQIPHVALQHQKFENPCTLRGKMGSQEVEISELWYRSFPLGGTSRRLARGQLVINHVGILKTRHSHIKHAENTVLFHLSAVEFFKETTASAMTDYSATPSQTVELFKVNVEGFGEITFLKQWAVQHIKEGVISANIHAGFYAEVAYKSEDAKNIDHLVESFREVLTIISIFFRQAVDLLGWEIRSDAGTETIWLNPLKPYIAPYMPYEPRTFLAFPQEFKICADELVSKYLSCSKEIKKVIRHLSVSIAPHIEMRDKNGFLAMFAALELVFNLTKLTPAEKQKLSESNAELTAHLNTMRTSIQRESSEFTTKLLDRVDGFIKTVNDRQPSFSVKITALFETYPSLATLAVDLWPIEGSDKKPGLKQIRNKLAHADHNKVDAQTVAVSRWHFSILIERLIFILVGAEVPKGIRSDSYLLGREEWYRRDYWVALQKAK